MWCVVTKSIGIIVSILLFRQVVEGMDVVKKIESLGSDSGKCSQKVIIADCGQLWENGSSRFVFSAEIK